MKKILTRILLLFTIILAVAFTLSGCNESDLMRLDTRLTVDGSFCGQRVITVRFPDSITASDASVDKLEKIITEACPKNLSYTKLEGDGVSYAFTLEFASKSDYCEKLKDVIGYEPLVSFGIYDNILTKGWNLYEDFPAVDTMKWLESAVEESGEKKLKFTFDCSNKPVVTVSGTTGVCKNTEGNIYAGDLSGYAVHSVEIQTTNYKDKNYDRKIILSFPESTYNKLGKNLEEYISELAGATKTEAWTKSGNYHVFEAFYENIDYTTLGNITASLLNCTDENVVYGDLTNSSTPLAEQLVFEENLNLLGFIPEKGKEVTLTYSYTLPSVTSIGDGIIKSCGSWQKAGQWNDGKYTLESSLPAVNVRIPDGMQYSVSGIDITLSHNDDYNFVRTVNFIYDSDSTEGYDYACSYFGNAGAEIVQNVPDGEKLVCSVVFKGSADEISEQLGKIFGGGNYISGNSKSSMTSVVTQLDFTDSMNIEYMLSENNANVPITYTFIKGTGEYITDMSVKENKTEKEIKPDKTSGEIKVTLKSGNASVNCNASVPYKNGILFCSICFSMLVILAVVLIMINISRQRAYNIRKSMEKKER